MKTFILATLVALTVALGGCAASSYKSMSDDGFPVGSVSNSPE